MRTALAALAVLAVLAATHAQASTCQRYQNLLSQCDFAANCSSPTRQEVLTYRQWLNSDTPLDACRKYYKKHWPWYAGPLAYSQATRFEWRCHVDVNRDGVLSRSEATIAHTSVWLVTVTRDTCCDANVYGPYWDLAVSEPPAGEGYFSPTQKTAFKAANEFNGLLWSDASAFNTSGGLNVDVDQLFYHSDIFNLDDDGGAYLYILADQAAEVDHIIPRKDSNGCMCGTNSNRNAAIISRGLNRAMSNDCENPARQAILNYYTLP